MIHLSQQPASQNSPRGFTLVELLVSISIMLILATISLAVVRNIFDADRVVEAASSFRAMLEGARSRAIRAQEARGVRLLLDKNDNRIVTSAVFVGTSEVIEGYLCVEYDNRVSGDPGYDVNSAGKWRAFDASELIDSTNQVYWTDLYQQGLLRRQCLLEIDGNPYRLEYRVTNEGIGGDEAWVLSQDFSSFDVKSPDSMGSQTWFPEDYYPNNRARGGRRPTPQKVSELADNDPSPNPYSGYIGLQGAVASDPIPYTLHLLPAILDGTAPVVFPQGACIDLDGSKITSSWRN
jgi:prepilin-type N-terminal cleavage/methylation domain-containing protein